MGKYLAHLAQWAPLMFLNLIPEQVQNTDKVKFLKKACCHPGNSRETQITAMCWCLAHAYRALFNTIQCSQGEEGENKPKGTAASLTPTTGAVAVPTPHNRHCSYSNPRGCPNPHGCPSPLSGHSGYSDPGDRHCS